MKRILLITLFFVSAILVNAQNKALSLYSFEESAGTFTSISGTGTLLTPNDWDDGVTDAITIGFDFSYNDSVYNHFTVNTNGTVNLGEAPINEETNDLESDVYVNLVTALWDDLKFYSNGVGDGIFMQLDGASGNYVLTIEYNNVGRYNSTGLVSYQVKFYESNNRIEFVYGDMSAATGWSEFSTTSIGMNADNSGTVEFLSVTPDATNGATISADVENDAITPATLAEIAEGTTYKFTPPSTATDPDIAVNAIISPNSNFLTANELVKIQFSNPGTEVTEGLQFAIEVYNNETGIMLSTIWRDYTDYPISSLDVIEYTFDTVLDLSANIEYKIQVSSHLDGDVDIFNNIVNKVVKGVVLDELIYDNGPIITREGNGAGGADISEVQTTLGMYNYGYNTNTVIGYRNADQFIVPEGEEWMITGLGFYNWQTESDTISTINHLDFRIYNGLPGEASSDTIADYYDINKLSGSKWSGIYRVYDTDIQNTDRPVMLSVASLDDEEYITLTEGTYWLDFSSGGTLLSGPWVPYITMLGETTTGDAWHLGFEGWGPWEEDGTATPQGMPFMLYGSKINGIQSVVSNQLKMYPNPGKGLFYFESGKSGILEVVDLSGRLVNQKLLANNNAIDLRALESGVYFVTLNTNEGRLTNKVIVE
jgi:hypothetical protein